MNWQPEQPDRESESLDRLLSEVRWEEPRPEAVRRLRVQWRTLMEKRSRRRRRRLFALAAAAALAGVGLMVWELGGRGAIAPRLENSTPSAPIAADETKGMENAKGAAEIVGKNPSIRENPFRQSPPPRSVQTVAASAPRKPNAYELVMLATNRRSQNNRPASVVSKPMGATESMGMGAGPRQSVAPAVETPVRNVAQTNDLPKLGQKIREEKDPALRQKMLLELLSRDDMQSVQLFLDRMEDAQTANDAIESLTVADNPPIEQFFQCLRSPRDGRRMAAARALGSLNRPEISRDLINLVNRGAIAARRCSP